MKRFMNWIIEFDRSFPDPWIVDGVEQVRPANQIGFLMGVAFRETSNHTLKWQS